MDPEGSTYLALVRCLAERAATFSLVWWKDPRTEPPSSLWATIRSSLLSAEERNEWPGTKLFGHTRLVTTHTIEPTSLSALLAASSLYSWLGNGLPEDPAFYSQDGRCIFGSIVHERDAFIYTDAVPIEVLEARVPGLKFRPRSS